MTERIGDGLVRIGAMSEDQREKILYLQNDGDTRLFGEIAVDLGYIDDQVIMNYLNRKFED